MARAKKAPPVEAATAPAASAQASALTAVKVLKSGRNFHNNGRDVYAYPLPTQDAAGVWTPGEWTPQRRVEFCISGWHLTRDPGRWWGDDVIAYLAEYDGATAGPDPNQTDDPTKIAAARVRLLRPLTTAELEAHGIYLTGEHDEISAGRVILGGTARVKRMTGTARIDRMDGTARIDWMTGTARIDWMTGTARIDRMTGTARIDRMDGTARIDWMDRTARIDRMTGTARIDWMTGTARIDWMDGTARIDRMDGTARIDWMTGTARIDWMTGTARIDRMDGTARIDWMTGTARIDWMTGTARIDRMAGTGTARIDWMTGTARIDRMTGTARIDRMDGTATAHASGEALVVVRFNTPTVTLRRNASALDYRSGRPVHRLADPGQVLTIAADGSISQAPEAQP